jgi:hypothetical protein
MRAGVILLVIGLGWSSAAAFQVARYDAFRDGGYAVM